MWPKQVPHKKDVAWAEMLFHRQTKYQYHENDDKKEKNKDIHYKYETIGKSNNTWWHSSPAIQQIKIKQHSTNLN